MLGGPDQISLRKANERSTEDRFRWEGELKMLQGGERWVTEREEGSILERSL